MSTRYILGNLRTGRRILDLPVLTGPWDDRLLAPETITVTVDYNDPDVQALDLRNTSTPAQTFLGVIEGDRIMAAGPIWTREYDYDSRTLTLGAKGLGSYFNYRHILPLLAASIGVDKWTVPDPADATKTIPNPLLSSTFSGVSLGTIAKRLIQQAELWTGGDLPIVFQPDEAADHTRTYLGVDFKPVMEAISDIANLENGPEHNFQPRFTSDMLGVEWLFETGTVANPLIVSPSVPLWDVSRPDSPVSALKITENGSEHASLAWQVGGRQEDEVLVARAANKDLTDAGYPLMEVLDSSHSTVSQQSTLDAYAMSDVEARQRAREIWSFTAVANPRDEDGNPSGPLVGSYRVGDYADLAIAKWNPELGTGDPYLQNSIEDGISRHRIIGIGGDERGETIKVSLAPRLE